MIATDALSNKRQGSPPATQVAEVVDMGQGPSAVVFLHGLFGTPEHWRPIMADLAGRYRVIAPQLPVDKQPGRRTAGVRTIDDLADFVEGLIDERALRQFVICGNSLGGLAAIDFCLRRPGRAAGLVLAGSAGLYERSLTNGVRPQPTRAFVRSVASDILYNKELVTDELVDEWHHAVLDRDYVRFLLRISRATRDRIVKDQLEYLRLPTLIVWGRNDEITPPSVARTFQSQIYGAQLEFIEHCGHAPNLERPEVFAQLLQEFLPRCLPSNARPQSMSTS